MLQQDVQRYGATHLLAQRMIWLRERRVIKPRRNREKIILIREKPDKTRRARINVEKKGQFPEVKQGLMLNEEPSQWCHLHVSSPSL